MSSSAVHTFANADDYAAAIRAATVEMTVTGRGPFTATLVRIDFYRLWMQRVSECLPRVLHMMAEPGRAGITFRTQPGRDRPGGGAVPIERRLGADHAHQAPVWLSNGYTTFFLSPEHGEGLYWGVGPVLYYPSATNSTVGVNKWGSGPSAAFIKMDESPWVLGAVVNNIWSLGGPPGSNDRTKQLLLNPFVNYHFADGWSVGASPEITANWIASGGKWTVPVGGGFGKAFRLSGQAIKLDFNAFYNAIRPKAGNDTWLLQVKLIFQFPD
jgi:hypothetical protein